MGDYVLLTDSSCDLPAGLAEELGVRVLPLSVSLNGKTYKNYLDEREIKLTDFYGALRAGGEASTAALNPGDIIEYLTPELEAGRDILYIAFASALSSTYHNGLIAAQELMDKYPGREVICLDSKCASLGQGLLVYLAAKRREEGADIHELRDYVLATVPYVCHWFTVDDLFFLKRGGRVSAATAAVGTLLNVKPVLHVDDEGRLINMLKARGRRAAIRSIYDKCAVTSENLEDQTVFISHGDCQEDADYLAGLVRENLRPREIIVNPIGPVIGAHSGPGTLAIFFLGLKR